MRRRQFFAGGLAVAVCAVGCGTERAPGGAAGLRARFSINPEGRRWARVGQVFAGAARAAGYQLGAGTKVTLTGLPALAAAEVNGRQALLTTTTPLARLSGEVEVVVVSGKSRFRDFEDFGAHLVAKPGQTPLVGGPQGEPDHLLFGLIAKGLGADTRRMDYTGYPSSEEAATALLSGKATAAAGLLADWRPGIGAGRVRALAVSTARRVPDLDTPTLLESGVRVDFADWVAAFGPEAMPDGAREAAIRMCDDVTGSPAWDAACRSEGWISIPLSGEDFELWLSTEVERTRAVLRDLGLLDKP
ncbi:Bug family tripartite tricarboxylate transporter substrate binding protein [Nonomuraea helvata]|uniref:Bug family tripartite tricarboxylate transporter substrate binding protein n=1 Tax=Nonomuraea helvata TaxID=37484 RepID=A0ABV5SGF6_9ACTN